MRSRANFLSHPIHPMLVPFPMAFTFGALGFGLLGRLGDWPSVWLAGAYLNLAALATGPLAGLFGLVDYLGTVPPKSSAKQRATSHMLVNVGALGALALSWIFRDGDTWAPGWSAIGLEAVAAGLIVWGGWLGGTLVYRNQIGVDHRYARAGKWSEARVDAAPGRPSAVAKADELEVDQMKLLHLPDGRRVVLARTESGYVAFDDHCTHKGGSLAGGLMACGVVTCPWHGSQYDASRGTVAAGPADRPIGTYKVEQSGGEVRLVL